jgi:hypothetical protein
MSEIPTGVYSKIQSIDENCGVNNKTSIRTDMHKKQSTWIHIIRHKSTVVELN